MRARIWAIYSHPIGFPNAGGFIASSQGASRTTLQRIARRMNRDGDGQHYSVREVFL